MVTLHHIAASVHISECREENKRVSCSKSGGAGVAAQNFCHLVLFKEVVEVCRRKGPFCRHVLFCWPGSGAGIGEEP